MEQVPYTIVIPARYGSSRLPGKPLIELAGRAMILHVVDRANEAQPSAVVVATDDARIMDVVTAAGGRAIMTSPSCVSGTDRLAEVCDRLAFDDDAIIVNLQGDEPLMPPSLVHEVARALAQNPSADMATLCVRITDPHDVFNPNAVKVVLARDGYALYFSRAPLPWVRGEYGHGAVLAELPSTAIYRHLGMYAYRASTLRRLSALAPSPLELAESLEQLRALESGMRIKVVVHDGAPPPAGVDTPADVFEVERVLRERV